MKGKWSPKDSCGHKTVSDGQRHVKSDHRQMVAQTIVDRDTFKHLVQFMLMMLHRVNAAIRVNQSELILATGENVIL